MEDLTDALVATGATLAFDATGGGKLAGQILACMEAALNRNAKEYSRYGSTTHKQVYIYGALDTRPDRAQPQLRHGLGRRRLAADAVPAEDRARGGAEAARARRGGSRRPTFASHYAKQVSLAEALQLGRDRRLRQASHRREVPDQSEQGDGRVAFFA